MGRAMMVSVRAPPSVINKKYKQKAKRRQPETQGGTQTGKCPDVCFKLHSFRILRYDFNRVAISQSEVSSTWAHFIREANDWTLSINDRIGTVCPNYLLQDLWLLKAELLMNKSLICTSPWAQVS